MERESGDGATRAVPFVTISRQAGAGGRSTADEMAKLLNERLAPPDKSDWTIFDRNLLEVVVEQHELPEEYMKYMEEENGERGERMLNWFEGEEPDIRAWINSGDEFGMNLKSNILVIGGKHCKIVARYG